MRTVLSHGATQATGADDMGHLVRAGWIGVRPALWVIIK